MIVVNIRKFDYGEKERNAVIDTVIRQLPLNFMYGARNYEDSYELLDGQRRTMSICEYMEGNFSHNHQYFHDLSSDEQNQILNYELMVYVFEGTDEEKFEWLNLINSAGMKYSDQELRNANYTGQWLIDAKSYFSKRNCPACNIANEYLNGDSVRQEHLETALRWIADRDGIEIEDYMSIHRNDTDATELWIYFQAVINWVKAIFPKYRKEMKGIEWGHYYNQYKDKYYNSNGLERRITELMQDESVTKKKGIFEYVIDGDERHLNTRSFTPRMKKDAYERQNSIRGS